MLYKLLKPIVYFLLKFFFRLEIKGKEVFPKNKPFILASNHLSNLDPVILGAACPFELVYLAKEELFANRFFSFFIKKLNAIPLYRQKVDIRTLRLAIKILKNKPIVIFPQGRRDTDYKDFKAGVGFLYRNSSAEIIAAKISGTDKVLPKRAKLPRLGKVSVVFSKVDDIKNSQSSEEIAVKVIEKIKNL